jgi:hypothetical protein
MLETTLDDERKAGQHPFLVDPDLCRSSINGFSHSTLYLNMAQQTRALHIGCLGRVSRSNRGLLGVQIKQVFFDKALLARAEICGGSVFAYHDLRNCVECVWHLIPQRAVRR